MTSVSRTTIIVAAGGPNSSAAAKTNVSETESLAGIPGMRIVNEPLRSVSTASTSQLGSTGARESEYRDSRTTNAPAATTTAMYRRLEPLRSVGGMLSARSAAKPSQPKQLSGARRLLGILGYRSL